MAVPVSLAVEDKVVTTNITNWTNQEGNGFSGVRFVRFVWFVVLALAGCRPVLLPQMAQISADDIELKSANICGFVISISVGFLDGCPRNAPDARMRLPGARGWTDMELISFNE